MQRMKWQLLWWLVFFLSHQPSACPPLKKDCNTTQYENSGGQGSCKDRCQNKDDSCCCMNYVDKLKNGSLEDTINATEELEDFIEKAEINGSDLAMTSDHVVALQYEPNANVTFNGFDIYVNDNENISYEPLPSSTLGVQLPTELSPGSNNTIVILKLKWPETNRSILGSPYEVYDRELVGLSVEGKRISGLQQRVNITINLTKEINETQKLSCQFFDFSTNKFSEDGCITLWTRGQNNVTCSCDHPNLTSIFVLVVPVSGSDKNGTESFSTHLIILEYISLTGCSLSLFTLVITVLLFITNRKLRESVSMKVHINLVIALILLNLHSLLSSTVAAVSSTGLCLYMDLALHYSLLATVSWTALEGFNLYLLVVKIFNINVSRYLLKLSVVGWGVPAVIVSVMLIIDRGFYGSVYVNTSNANNTGICYITNNGVKMATTVGPLFFVFLFNVIVFGVTIRRVFTVVQSRETDCKRVMQSICRLLGVCILLGLTWGLIFFSSDSVGQYLFYILNSLQESSFGKLDKINGFFIFLWFVMSLRKS